MASDPSSSSSSLPSTTSVATPVGAPLGTPYAPRLRTALVFTGTGSAGAYHAGVMKALAEAGVKVDLVAGRGMGAGRLLRRPRHPRARAGRRRVVVSARLRRATERVGPRRARRTTLRRHHRRDLQPHALRTGDPARRRPVDAGRGAVP